MASNILPK